MTQKSSDFDDRVLEMVRKQQAGFDTPGGIAQNMNAAVPYERRRDILKTVSASLKRLERNGLVFYNKDGRFYVVV